MTTVLVEVKIPEEKLQKIANAAEKARDPKGYINICLSHFRTDVLRKISTYPVLQETIKTLKDKCKKLKPDYSFIHLLEKARTEVLEKARHVPTQHQPKFVALWAKLAGVPTAEIVLLLGVGGSPQQAANTVDHWTKRARAQLSKMDISTDLEEVLKFRISQLKNRRRASGRTN